MMEKALRQGQTFEWMSLINQVTAEDRSHLLSFANVWDLPFGRNRAFLNNMGRAGETVLGNWKLNSALLYQSGVPLNTWSGWQYLCGNPQAGGRTETRWFDNTRSCYQQLTPFQYTQLPARFHQIRSQAAPQLDLSLSKVFKLGERYEVEFRGESYNVTNTPLRQDAPSTNPSASDFGVLPVAQLNFARQMELALRFRF
jgi:hypothetical protein